jgi:exosortase E/protease (VPEID-CTERM system)
MTLALRLLVGVLILGAEKSILNLFVDFASADAAHGLGAAVRIGQHWGFRFAVTLVAALALFGYVRDDARLTQLNADARGTPLRGAWFVLHLALVLPLLPLSHFLYAEGAPLPFAALVTLWMAFALAATIALFLGLGPWPLWRRAAQALGVLWLYAGATATASAFAMEWTQRLWEPTARITFELVAGVLAPLLPNLQRDPAALILATDKFAVQIAEVCSGLEGIGLMLAFCCAWLVYFRKEYRFPRALLLIPVGVVLIFLLNVLRIAAFVLIGHAGYPNVAVYGFHSQAGWIAFNAAAGAIAFFSRRNPWLNRTASRDEQIEGDNPTAAYLMPLLAILAAGMLAVAVSSGFETLYVLRLAAACAALWLYRVTLARVDWRFSWRGPAAGILTFVIWLCAARWLLPVSSMPTALASMPVGLRAAWIGIRLTASIITVPIAEELAYRGYLLRRICAADFESVPFATVGLGSLLVSSVVFGVAHGSMWPAGVAAGAIYGALVIRTGRLGEAVAAHATTNALVAASVLLGGQWQLW